MKNKKANVMAIIIIVGALFILLFFGLLMVIGSSIINWTMDEVVPELSGIGTVPGTTTNFSEYSDMTITPVNTLVQNFTWMTGVLYILGLMGIFGIAFAFKTTGNKMLIAFFVGLMLLLVIASLFISNIYEDFYDDGGELGTRLQEHGLLSWLILYSPMIMSIVGFMAGIILFSGASEETFV